MRPSLIIGTLFVSGRHAVLDWCGRFPSGLVVAASEGVLSRAVWRGSMLPNRAEFLFGDCIGGMAKSERRAAVMAAWTALGAVRMGLPVLVASDEGRNRACLIAALVHRMLDRVSADHALSNVRAARGLDLDGPTLSNPYFRQLLQGDEDEWFEAAAVGEFISAEFES